MLEFSECRRGGRSILVARAIKGGRKEGKKEGKGGRVRSELASYRAGNFVIYFLGARSEKECLR